MRSLLEGLNWEVTQWRISLAAELRIGCRKTKVEARDSANGLSQGGDSGGHETELSSLKIGLMEFADGLDVG